MDGRPTSGNGGALDRGVLGATALLVVAVVVWVLVVTPAIEEQGAWAASPWPVLVVALLLYSYRRRRRQWATVGIETHSSRAAASRALRTGRLPDDPSDDQEIRALIDQSRGQYTRHMVLGVRLGLIASALLLLAALGTLDPLRMALGAASVGGTLWIRRSTARTLARWDPLEAEVDARASAPPPEAPT